MKTTVCFLLGKNLCRFGERRMVFNGPEGGPDYGEYITNVDEADEATEAKTLNWIGKKLFTLRKQNDGQLRNLKDIKTTEDVQNIMSSSVELNDFTRTYLLQVMLAEKGLYTGTLDGVPGPQTRKAFTDFRTRHNLSFKKVQYPKDMDKVLQVLLASKNLSDGESLSEVWENKWKPNAETQKKTGEKQEEITKNGGGKKPKGNDNAEEETATTDQSETTTRNIDSIRNDLMKTIASASHDSGGFHITKQDITLINKGKDTVKIVLNSGKASVFPPVSETQGEIALVTQDGKSFYMVEYKKDGFISSAGHSRVIDDYKNINASTVKKLFPVFFSDREHIQKIVAPVFNTKELINPTKKRSLTKEELKYETPKVLEVLQNIDPEVVSIGLKSTGGIDYMKGDWKELPAGWDHLPALFVARNLTTPISVQELRKRGVKRILNRSGAINISSSRYDNHEYVHGILRKSE